MQDVLMMSTSFEKLCATFGACRASNQAKADMLMVFLAGLHQNGISREKFAIHEGPMSSIEWTMRIDVGKDAVLGAVRNGVVVLKAVSRE